jgi:hypothetical protein
MRRKEPSPAFGEASDDPRGRAEQQDDGRAVGPRDRGLTGGLFPDWMPVVVDGRSDS